VDLQGFKNYLSINLGKKSALNYEGQMKSFFKQHEELTQDTLNQYLSSKVDKWGAGSHNCFFKAIRWYFKYTKTTLDLPTFKRVEKGKARPYLKEKDIQDIFDKLPLIIEDYKKAQCVLEILFYSGIRPKELLTLQRKNVNIEERQVVLVDTKTFKSRTVFLTPSLAKKISYIFERETEKENAFNLNETTISYYCQKISECLNIKLNQYMTRHSFAHLYLKKSGNDLISLSKTLGHNNLATTQIYSEIDDKERQERFDKIFKEKR
jgi:site-specific recombinase XerD